MPDQAVELGSEQCPLRVAIVGSGPSGFYAADYLLRSGMNVHVHMFERLPTPFGLVRFGVAPDHAKIRNVIKVYAKTAQHPNYRFWGNITIGSDITMDELRAEFDAVILAFGAQTDRKLNIPGVDLPRSYTATEFCAWYNSHPDYRDREFDLSHPVAMVMGQGNVAMDVARVLAKTSEQLSTTDMASHAVDALADSQVREVHVVGRRGPAQAAFTPKEIKELGEIEGCDIIVNPDDLRINENCAIELELPGNEANKRNMEILREFADRKPTGAPRKIIIHFFKSPIKLRGNGGVEQVVLERNKLVGEPGARKARGTGETETLDCQVFFRSIGYHGVPIEGTPFDEGKGVVPNESGRVEPGLYAVGWIKRGPSGLIGTNKKDSEESVDKLFDDLKRLEPKARDDSGLRAILKQRGVRPVSYEDWLKIDAAEVERGQAKGKPRDNFTRIDEMIAVLDGQPSESR